MATVQNTAPAEACLSESKSVRSNALESLAYEIQREISTVIAVEMALSSCYDPYPGRERDNSDAVCALRGARTRLEDLTEQLENLGMANRHAGTGRDPSDAGEVQL